MSEQLKEILEDLWNNCEDAYSFYRANGNRDSPDESRDSEVAETAEKIEKIFSSTQPSIKATDEQANITDAQIDEIASRFLHHEDDSDNYIAFAKAVLAANKQQLSAQESAWRPSDQDVLQWADRHSHIIETNTDKIMNLRTAIDDARSMMPLPASPTSEGG